MLATTHDHLSNNWLQEIVPLILSPLSPKATSIFLTLPCPNSRFVSVGLMGFGAVTFHPQVLSSSLSAES
jgi:hypothetical protein